MRVLVTGAGGQLGIELSEILHTRGYGVVALTREDLDIAEPVAVEWAVGEYAPDLVINTAAFTDVDGCEKEPEKAYAVNALGPRNLARCCEASGAILLQVSTNYVFDGESDEPYATSDAANPVSVYGRTKLAGEEFVERLCARYYVVRTAGVYGQGHNFVRTMLRVGRERDALRIKADEYVSPTYARDLAGGIVGIVEEGRYGFYHVTNSGSCSWFEFASKIFTMAEIEVEVTPVPSAEYPLPAARPRNGVLATSGSPRLRHWQEALADYLQHSTVA